MQESYAQNFKKQYELADKYVEDADFEAAKTIYIKLLTDKPNNANLSFKIAYCYFMIPSKKDSSIIFFENIGNRVSDGYNNSYSDTVAPVEALVFLADIYHSNYKFEMAKNMYKEVLNFTNNQKLKQVVELKLSTCETAIKLFKNSNDITRIKLGGNINTRYNEHSPVLTADLKTIIFTSNRKGTGGLKDKDGKYYEDIYISEFKNGKWTKPESISKNINTNKHEASVGLSPDGNTLLIYKGTNNGDIYISEKKDDEWSIPKALGKNINTKHRETHASISVTKQTMYFTSNRPGGFGGMDLYYSQKQNDGTWGKAINMGENVNTLRNEEGPFIHPDDTTLFFSSNGHIGMGGYDLFMSFKQTDNTWSKPVNIGYPVNSPSDDVFYIASPGGNYAFYVTNQIGSSGTNGIYMLGLPERFRKKTAVFSGKVKLYDETINTEISVNVIDIDTKTTIRTYNTNKKGEYTIILPTNKKFLVSYDAIGYLSHIIEIDVADNADLQSLKKVIFLQPIVVGGTNENYKLEFSPNSKEINFKTKYKMDKAIKQLSDNEELVVALNIPKKDSLNYSKVLSVKNYLINNRVDSNRVKLNYTNRDYYELLIVDTVFLKFSENIEFIKFVPNKKDIEVVSKHYLSQLVFFIERNKELCIEIPVYEKTKLWEKRLSELFNYLVSNGTDSLQIRMKIITGKNKYENKIKPSLAKRTFENPEFLFSVSDKGYILSKDYQISVPVLLNYEAYFSRKYKNEILKKLASNKIDTTRIVLKPIYERNNYVNKTQSMVKLERGHSASYFSTLNSKKDKKSLAIHFLPKQEEINTSREIPDIKKVNTKNSTNSTKVKIANKFAVQEKYLNKVQKNINRNK